MKTQAEKVKLALEALEKHYPYEDESGVIKLSLGRYMNGMQHLRQAAEQAATEESSAVVKDSLTAGRRTSYADWIGQPERLVYLGLNWSGNGFWHQFALVGSPDKVWCEVLGRDLKNIEETKEGA